MLILEIAAGVALAPVLMWGCIWAGCLFLAAPMRVLMVVGGIAWMVAAALPH